MTGLIHDPPRERVGAGLQLAIAAAFLGVNVAIVPALSLTVALKVDQVDPDNRATALSLVLGVGAVVALLAQNVFGALSDRTTSRFGMRRPWIAAGMVSTAASLLLLAGAQTLPALVLGWAGAQLCFNILLAGLNPVVPDQVPPGQLGRVSGLIGVVVTLANVAGVVIAQAFLPNLTLAIAAPGVVTVIGSLVLLVVLRDRVLPHEQRPALRWTTFVKAYWTSPRQAPDFALAWVSRFLVYFGNFTLINYQTYFLLDEFGFTPTTIGPATVLLAVIGVLGTAATSLAVGAVSDRIHRRKIFVLISALLLAGAHVLAALAPSFPVFVAATALAALATGVYLAVDAALIAEVLPSRADIGKDMGVLHLANVLPQSLVPVTAPAFLLIGGTGDNYAAVFLAGAVAGIAGAVVNQFIRSVR